MAGIYFIVLPVVWLGVLGPEAARRRISRPCSARRSRRCFGSFGKAAAIWFIMLNMFHGTLQPLGGRRAHACRS